ncbi:segregation and condensation protein A [Peptococcus simiae]|uniref:Segregation and condensation protein A n=1 Tax=Peptococcus simiae TaxID=1643805 RepID=A0ABW9H0V1_9FIRM
MEAYPELAFKWHDFEGPMDLLMHLLEKDKIDISDIPIATLTDQYLAYLQEAESMNLEIASDFLLMAANLVRIKVRMLMPRPRKDEAEDPRQDLVAQILEYRFIRDAADFLNRRYSEEAHHLPRPVDTEDLAKQYQADLPLDQISLEALLAAYQSAVQAHEERVPQVQMRRSEVSIEVYTNKLLNLVQTNKGLTFSQICRRLTSKMDIIGYFLALLECLRHNMVQVIQTERFGEIWLHNGLEGHYEH